MKSLHHVAHSTRQRKLPVRVSDAKSNISRKNNSNCSYYMIHFKVPVVIRKKNLRVT